MNNTMIEMKNTLLGINRRLDEAQNLEAVIWRTK